MAEKLVIEIDGNITDYKKKVGEVKGVNEKLAKGLKTVAKGAAIGFTALAGGIALTVNEARKIETITTQFEVLTGSAAEASKIVKDLQDFSAKTPFQFEGISKAATQLLGFGFAADEIPDKLQKIGDVASAAGKPIEEIGFIYGQVAAAGKLTGERLLQFQERAIPIGPAIAKSMGVAETAVKDLVSKGEVSLSIFEEAFASLSAEGGVAFEGMIKQSKTLDGVLSTTKDNIALLAADIGKEFLPVVKELTLQFLGFIQALRESDGFIEAIKGTISVMSKIVLGTAEAFETLGMRIGAIMAAVSEAVSAALELNFKKAADAFKNTDEAFKQDLLATQKDYAEKSKAIDDALYAEKSEAQIAAQEKELANAQAQNDKKLAAEQQVKDDQQQKFDEELASLEEDNILKTEKDLELFEQRIQAKKEAEELAKVEELQNQGKHDEAMVKLEEIKNKKIIDSSKKRLEQEKQIQQVNLKATRNFISAGAQLAQDGSDTQKALLTANALISTYSAASQALAAPPGPPFTVPLSASVVALGLANVAKINNVKFAEGGVFSGGIPGVDSINASVKQNEIIAPVQNFEEVIGSVRAKREAENLGGGLGGSQHITIGFTDNAFEIIEAGILERREEGVSSI